MRAIVAIGGGDFKLGETVKIDQYLVSLSKKQNPKLLFIPTASEDSQEYMDQIDDYFNHFGCEVSFLCLLSETNLKKIRDKILSADIIYVGGGDATLLMETWRKLHVDTYLIEAYYRGVILSGLSAGAICWFNEGFVEPDRELNGGQWCFEDAHGLGLIDGICCPHYNQDYRGLFDKFISTQNQIGFGMEDSVALVKLDDEYFVYQGNDYNHVNVLKPHYYGLDKKSYGHKEEVKL